MERADRKRRAVISLGILLVWCRCASALNPSLDINQYAHTAWTVRDGLFKGIIFSIAQTPDGYLWLATEFGLLRFDGARSVPWEPPAGQHLPSSEIRTVLAARDGRLWIGTSQGLASWKDGKLSHYPELAGQIVATLLEDREGTLWAGGWATSTGRLCAIQSGSAQCYGEDGSLGQGVYSLYRDSGGNLWAGAFNGLWRWKPGPPKRYPMPNPAPGINALIEADNGALLIAARDGLRQLVDGTSEAYPLPAAGRQFTPNRLLRDRNGSLWIGTADRGLLHVHQGGADLFTRSDGLSGDLVESLFEDREGNIWVATGDGLDRFRDFVVPTISVKQGLSKSGVGSVLAARDGSVWLGTEDGLNRWNNGQLTIYRKRSARLPSNDREGVESAVREIIDSGLPDGGVESLAEDDRGRIWVYARRGVACFENGRFVGVSTLPGGLVHSMAGGGAGDLWISHTEHGIFHLHGGSLVEQIPWARLGSGDVAVALFADFLQGGLWLGFHDGGVKYFKDGQVRASYAGADGLGQGRVNQLQLDRDGTLWAATQGGLSRVKNGRVNTLSNRNGLPCDAVKWAMEDDDHAVWLYMACGLVRIARTELDAWAATVDKDPKRAIQVRVFDSSDGVISHAFNSGYGPRVAKSADGRLWFLPLDGVSIIDPRHLPFNQLPPPVYIEQVRAGGKIHEATPGLRLPALVRDVWIDYTALSLVAPEKVHFRYRLEGQDPDWIEVVNDRQAQYSNLPPRNYRFRVMASNNSGLWNEAGDTLEFSIAPAYYQTTWFYASCVAAFLAILWGLYRLRLYQIAREFNAQLDGRVDERLRVARDLHDTMLQTFQAALIQMQAGYNMLARRPEKAAEAIQRAITTSAGAIDEGRQAIQKMRSSTEVTNDLARAFRMAGDQMAAEGSAKFDVRVQGSPRDVHPILRDEVYRIALEALRNAFNHSGAKAIEAEIVYGDSLLVRIRDDGKGIDPAILNGGRSGHYGLPGMRERAESIGGKLDVWTGPGAGTEIQLSIPGNIAFGKAGRRLPLPAIQAKGKERDGRT